MNNSFVKLEVNDPINSTYPEYGGLFSIIDLNNSNIWNWVFSNFIHLVYFDNNSITYKHHRNILSDCPFFLYYSFPGKFIVDKCGSIIEFIIEMINDDSYVTTVLDLFYITDSFSYKRVHNPHFTLLYGYDKRKEVFYVSDNLKDGKYRKTEYKFADVENAFKSAHQIIEEDNIIFSYKRRNCDFSFSIEYLVKELQLYLNPSFVNIEDTFTNDNVLCYSLDGVSLYFNSLRNNKIIDVRGFHLFYEHKIIMVLRLNFLFEKSYLKHDQILIKKIIDLRDNYLLIRNMVIKYNISHDERILQKINNDIETAIDTEREFISTLINKLIQENNLVPMSRTTFASERNL